MHQCELMKEYIIPRKGYDYCQDYENKYIYYIEKYDEYGIMIPEDGSYLVIHYCPWCGEKFPESKRNLWFKEIKKLGYTNGLDEDIPKAFETGEWYRHLEIDKKVVE